MRFEDLDQILLLEGMLGIVRQACCVAITPCIASSDALVCHFQGIHDLLLLELGIDVDSQCAVFLLRMELRSSFDAEG